MIATSWTVISIGVVVLVMLVVVVSVVRYTINYYFRAKQRFLLSLGRDDSGGK